MSTSYRPPTAQRRSLLARFGHRHPWILLLFILAFAAGAAMVRTPWALRIGGRFTPTLTWDGFGALQASNGGHYLLFTDLHGGAFAPGYRGHSSCNQHGCVTLYGTATMCSRAGGMESFQLEGNVHGWLRTDGARTTMDLTRGSPQPLPSGWVVAFHGRWEGPDLVLDSPDNSFTEVFTPDGRIRRVTSTADAGSARLTLRYGSRTEFEEACRALVGGRGA